MASSPRRRRARPSRPCVTLAPPLVQTVRRSTYIFRNVVLPPESKFVQPTASWPYSDVMVQQCAQQGMRPVCEQGGAGCQPEEGLNFGQDSSLPTNLAQELGVNRAWTIAENPTGYMFPGGFAPGPFLLFLPRRPPFPF